MSGTSVVSGALTHRQLLLADRDYQRAASAAHLVYVSDSQPGIVRKKSGKGYSYTLKGSVIRDKEELERIRKLVVPPSWTAVWICAKANGHIQATGLDLKGRKQYRYHALWNAFRNETKFHRLYEFGKALPLLRAKIEADLSTKGLSREKVLATVLSLMERTYIRVGNNEYERTNGSYGLTTLKNKHVAVTGEKISFSFTGKKGVHHAITVKNRRLARIVRQCHDLPGKELFQYEEEDGSLHAIDSGMVNQYIHEMTELDFTAKDFRTWAGSLHALLAFRAIGEAAGVTECKKNIASVLDKVSVELGNTRAVCKKYYIHPGLIRLYEENKLMGYLRELDDTETHADEQELAPEEVVLMKILRKYISAA